MYRNACLTFFNPENERRMNQKLSSSEFTVIKNSSVLLFVIDNASRSLFTMILVSPGAEYSATQSVSALLYKLIVQLGKRNFLVWGGGGGVRLVHHELLH